MSRIVIAPDSFKGSATSIEVAASIAKGWKSVRPNDEVIQIPFADGGEGTLLAIEYVRPDAQRVYCPQVSPDAYWLLLDGSTAIVELAQVSGLNLLPVLDPLGAHTFAFGQVLSHAAHDSRVQHIYCALGGSASTDAGVGALIALGFEFFDASGISIKLGGEELLRITSISTSKVIKPPEGGVILLVDVQSPLLGIEGAAAIFAPQKAASRADVVRLESALTHFAGIASKPDFAGGGAAGGTAYGLCALWGATIESGAKKIAELSDFDTEIKGADLIITGEGRLDSQSFKGKVVGQIINRATAAGVATAFCVGSVEGDFPSSSMGGVSLSDIAGSSLIAMQNSEKYLFEAGVQLAQFV